MKRYLFFVILLLSIFFVSCATEKSIQEPSSPQEKCYAPGWNEGDSWRFTGDRGGQWEEKIIREGDTFKIKQTSNKGYYGIFGVLRPDLFPLWVGKKIEGTVESETVQGYPISCPYSFKVIGVVDIKVEAGTFKCWKIEYKTYSTSFGVSDLGIGYYYYSPETKSVIKFFTQSQFLAAWENYELLSFNLR